MSFEIRALPPWPDPYLPAGGQLVFYDPTTDVEYSVVPEQVGGAGLAFLPSLQTFRFRTRAEANVGFGGQVLEELDYSTLFTYARVLVEFWRDNPANLGETPRGQELIAVYDPNAPASHLGYATSGGPAAGVSRVGLVLVFPDDPRATGVLKYDPNQSVMQGQLRYYDAGQGVQFYQALQNMLSPVPAPVPGTTTAYWKPTAPPAVPGATSFAGLLGRSTTRDKAIAAMNAKALTIGSDILLGTWNGQPGGVLFLPIGPGHYFPLAVIESGGALVLVIADPRTGKFETFDDYVRRLAGSGGVAGATPRDPLAAGDNLALVAAVTDAGNTWDKGDLVAYATPTLQQAAAPPAQPAQHASILVGDADVATMDEFDHKDANGFAWRYRYSRRNDGTSGWTRIAKTA
jgi:hypothetical protein